MQNNRQEIIHFIQQLLEDKKGENIEIFDLKDTDYFVDYVMIATAFVDKHALALLDTLKKELKQKGESFFNIDDENPNWIVADLGDIIVHIFTENQRKKFNLEEFLSKIAMQQRLES
ncbi:ribosome silencing factor [Helicobacter pullorum]|uniref:ribosome silencing factor n=1 Tax=Helicobacter pullorum TaxID=35818 RepID=UPI001DD1F52B|nr:ribosome silencing factor [Helicobacter pullorum]HJF82802.1 ribosome silencing factor [Helicobacter pullorum]